MFNGIGTAEVIIIALVVLMLFGGKKIPEFTRSLTQAAKEFRAGLKEEPAKHAKKSKP